MKKPPDGFNEEDIIFDQPDDCYCINCKDPIKEGEPRVVKGEKTYCTFCWQQIMTAFEEPDITIEEEEV